MMPWREWKLSKGNHNEEEVDHHRVWPDTKSFPDKMRSKKVSTVGRTAPKTRIFPRKNASVAFIVPVFKPKMKGPS